MNKKTRNVNLDLIRSVAVFFVISVHFFLYNDFYTTPVVNGSMILMIYIRNLFMVCVPLFLLLTGYLNNKKELNRQYYFKINKILMIYVVASLFSLLHRRLFSTTSESVIGILNLITNFSASPYAWYVAMYIGLFLMIPFLNILYWNLETKRHKQLLVGTLVILSFSRFGWTSLYPLAYYFIGAYISEYKINMPKIKNSLLIVASIFIFGSITVFNSYGKSYASGVFNDWGGLPNFVTATLIFILLLNLNLGRLPSFFKGIIAKIAELSLATYLLSYMFDRYIYDILVTKVPIIENRLPWYFVAAPIIFILSLLLAQLVVLLSDILLGMFLKAKSSN